jgi:tRNA(Arg) A34 adenosine deaminase TadA
MSEDLNRMRLALEEAKSAAARDEVAVGALIVHARTGEIIARAGNRSIEMRDPSAHAEMLAIRQACEKLGAQRIPECDLYVTLEPCTMCAGAISFARIRRLVIGAPDIKGGAVMNGVRFFDQRTCHHRPEATDGLLAQECGDVLRDFFAERRQTRRL